VEDHGEIVEKFVVPLIAWNTVFAEQANVCYFVGHRGYKRYGPIQFCPIDPNDKTRSRIVISTAGDTDIATGFVGGLRRPYAVAEISRKTGTSGRQLNRTLLM
jgi:hypothetical protein